MKFAINVLAEEPSVAEIHVNDFIGDWIDDYFGFGVTAKAFLSQLAEIPENVRSIRVHLNSPGGDVAAAMAITNALRDQRTSKGRTVETVVDGMAASAATLILMAGSPVKMADNALLMVHNPSTVAYGSSKDFRSAADMLDTVRDTIVTTYQWQSSLSAKDLQKLMDAETWMTADEAIANGFVTDKIEGLAVSASLTRKPFEKLGLNVPEAYKARVESFLLPTDTGIEDAPQEIPVTEEVQHSQTDNDEAPAAAPVAPAPEPEPAPAPAEPEAPAAQAVDQPATADEILAICAGQPSEFAAALIREKCSKGAATKRVADVKEKAAAEVTRVGDITALCGRFKTPGLTKALTRPGVSLEVAKEVVLAVKAEVDQLTVIDSSLEPDSGTRRGPGLSVHGVYADRNGRRK